MAPKKGVKRGSLREQTKELLILTFFLHPGADEKATADAIREAWNPKNPHAIGSVLPKGIGPRDPFLSRSGANKICRRLADDGVLKRMPEIGYRNKKVFYYSLAPPESGFLKVARKLEHASTLLMESGYGKRGIREFLIPRIQKNLEIDLGDWREKAEWVLGHSPTAFAIGTDDSLGAGEISRLKTEKERLQSFLDVLACAMTVDRSMRSRGRLIAADKNAGDIELALRTRTCTESSKDVHK